MYFVFNLKNDTELWQQARVLWMRRFRHELTTKMLIDEVNKHPIQIDLFDGSKNTLQAEALDAFLTQ
jgi:hypothetical protein